jgi:hypothetical protein
VEIAVVAVQIEKLHLQIEKQEKEDHVKVVKLQKVAAVKVKADVEAVAIKIVNHFFASTQNAWKIQAFCVEAIILVVEMEDQDIE